MKSLLKIMSSVEKINIEQNELDFVSELATQMNMFDLFFPSVDDLVGTIWLPGCPS